MAVVPETQAHLHHPITTHSPTTALSLQSRCMDTDTHWVPWDHKDVLAE